MRRLCISEIDHDASIALFEDDRLLGAVSEERLSRVKLHAGFPERSVDWALAEHGLAAGDLDEVCIAKPEMDKEMRLIFGALRDYSPLAEGMSPLAAALDYAALNVYKRAQTTREIARLNGQIRSWLAARRIEGSRVRREFNHHFLHAASAYFGSGFTDALAVTTDGQGGGVTASVYACRGGRMERLHEVKWPHSMGVFYGSVTRALGFKPNRHEGKITGLAGYEPPSPEALALCRAMARSRGGTFTVNGVYGRYPELLRLVRRSSPASVAAAFQIVLEEVLRDFARHYVDATGLTRVVLAGGVFANVKLNQRIAEIPAVEEVFVFPGMADVGLCWGLGAWESARRREFSPRAIPDVYWGPSYSEEAVAAALCRAGVSYRRVDDVATTVGDLLAEGHVVFRFSGRMEFGPRALGNRSVLFHTRDKTVNDWLNKLLRRTEFMPFAPVTLAEEAHHMYRGLDRGRKTAAFMTITFECTDEMKAMSPAAVHVDGTARPQIIEERVNPTYHGIVRRYHQRTGIPSVINTSFNMHEEPIVCSPDDAVRAYLDAKVGALSIGNFLVTAFDTPGRAPHAQP
jgi:carbamoyltransferase